MTDQVRIPGARLHAFAAHLLCKAGMEAAEAEVIAGIFVWFEAVGRRTQGLVRLESYFKRLRLGLIRSPCNAEFKSLGASLGSVDGKDGFGHYVADLAMDKAIEMATRTGIGVVAVRHSNHFGSGSWYVHKAAANLKIGFAFTNSVPKVAAHGGISPVLGTNPMSFGAPMRRGESVLVDFSTASSSGSGMGVKAEEDATIPEGIAVCRDGRPARTAREAAEGTLLPFGGAKGFCLGFMVEILAGVLSGAGVSHQIASFEKNFERASNVGHFFVVLDVLRWMDAEAFFQRMDGLVSLMKGSALMPGVGEVLIPGEKRWREYRESLVAGVLLDPRTVKRLRQLCADFQVECPC